MAGRRLRGGHSVRETQWIAAGGWTNITMTTSGGTILFSLDAVGLALRPFTVIRSHFELLLISDQAAAIEVQLGAIGVCVVSDQASAIGITAVPTPITDAESDLWQTHQFYAADESNLTDRTKNGTHMSVDSKAMRKVNADEDLLTVVEMDTTGNGQILSVAVRQLIKLH